MTQPVDTAAPHGRDGNGTPLAPYGLNVDGTPRKSNRGARPGQKGNRKPGTTAKAAPSLATSNLTDEERKGMLIELAESLLVTPLAGLSQAPFLKSRIGGQQTDALAGDAFILSQYAPGLADGAILLSKTKPKTLAWMDKIEANAPYILLMKVGIDMTKAFVENHLNPNPQLAQAGRSLAALRMAQMAQAVNEEATRIQTEQFEQAAAQRAYAEAA